MIHDILRVYDRIKLRESYYGQVESDQTFVHMVNVGFLSRSREHDEHHQEDVGLGVTVPLPFDVMHHVKETSQQIQHAMLWTVL